LAKAQMRSITAITIEMSVGREVLKPAQKPMREPQTGQLLVEVKAAGIKRPDLLQRIGRCEPPPRVPEWHSLEGCGRIAATGPGVTGFKAGDRVMALVAGGGYATHAIVDAPLAFHVPDKMTDIEAGAFAETFFTVWVNVFMRAKLKAGESFLVHGGASGIGT